MKSKTTLFTSKAKIMTYSKNSYSYHLTDHGQQRLSQRGLALDAIEIVYWYGERICKQGLSFYFMKSQTILKYNLNEKLEGIVLVMDDQKQQLITAYKNRGALKAIKRKKDYNAKPTIRRNYYLQTVPQ